MYLLLWETKHRGHECWSSCCFSDCSPWDHLAAPTMAFKDEETHQGRADDLPEVTGVGANSKGLGRELHQRVKGAIIAWAGVWGCVEGRSHLILKGCTGSYPERILTFKRRVKRLLHEKQARTNRTDVYLMLNPARFEGNNVSLYTTYLYTVPYSTTW